MTRLVRDNMALGTVCLLMSLALPVNDSFAEEAEERTNLALNNVVVLTVKNEEVTRGPADSTDTLGPSDEMVSRFRPLLAILKIGDKPGSPDYREKEDYKLSFQGVDWSPKGKEPAEGATYYVTYQHVFSESGHNTTGAATRAVDGNLTSEWRVIGKAWLFLDLGSKKEIRQVVIRLLKPVQSFSIMYAEDEGGEQGYMPTKWVDLKSADGTWQNPLPGLTKLNIVLNTALVKSRYIKFVAHKGDENNVTYLAELQVYSDAGGLRSSTDLLGSDVVRLSECTAAPRIDGKLSPDEWKGAHRISDFNLVSSKGKARALTEGGIAFDSGNLCFFLNMKNTLGGDIEQLRRKYRSMDDRIWLDDSVEIQLDTNNDEKGFYHFTINANEVWIDMYNSTVGGGDVNWNCDIRVRSDLNPKRWLLEVAIPFAALGVNPPYGEVWGINVRRINYLGKKEVSSWADIYPSKVTHPPDKFRKVLFQKDSKAPLIVLGKGDLSPAGNQVGSNTLNFSITSTMPDETPLNCSVFSLLNSKRICSVEKKIVPGEGKKILNLPYSVSGEEGEKIFFEISSAGGNLLYKGWHPVQFHEHKRVYEVRKPLFDRLIRSRSRSPLYGGGIFWAHILIKRNCTDFAKRFGVEYDFGQVLSEHADLNSYFLCGINTEWLLEAVRNYKDRPGFLIYPNYRYFKEEAGNWAFYPKNVEKYFSDIDEAIENYSDVFKGVYTGDEYLSHTLTGGIKCFMEKDKYPFILEVDREVKSNYGFGKYGIPLSLSDPNPYRWIAYYRYCNKTFLDIMRRIHAVVRKKRPDWIIVSQDPTATLKPFDYYLQSPYVDVFTNQFVPRANSNRPALTYMSKLYKDLTGKPFWPCVHLEQVYFGAKPPEVRTLLSQIFVGGGSGFHFWLKDTDYRWVTHLGSPPRWEAIKEVMGYAQKMRGLRYPRHDSVLFYSNYSHQAANKDATEMEYWFHLLGPYAGTWFKIVDEHSLKAPGRNIRRARAIFLPYCTYIDRKTADYLREYVMFGGTLIAGDPNVFSNYIDGEDATMLREKLFGVKVIGERKASAVECLPSPDYKKSLILNNTGKTVKIKVSDPHAKILARFKDGDPAIVSRSSGRGKTVYFAFQAGTSPNIADKNWRKFIKTFCSSLRLKVDNDIWRFRFPELKAERGVRLSGLCLTGNYLRFIDDSPVKFNNTDTGGTYSYSIPPNVTDDEGGKQDIPFNKGDLTDRFQALKNPKARPKNFLVSWKGVESPVSVTFDLKKPYPIEKLKVFYSGSISQITAQTSNDASTFRDFASLDNIPTTEGVLSVELTAANPNPTRFLKLAFHATPQISNLSLIELELWQKSSVIPAKAGIH